MKVQTAGGGTETRHDLTYVRESEQDVQILSEPGKETATVFKPTAAGTYNVTLTAKDAAGAEARTVISFDVYGGQAGTWAQRDGVKIDRTADRYLDNPGDTAKIVVKSPFKGQVLVSVERERVRKIWLTEVDGNGAVVEIPIDESYAPNCFVSAWTLAAR